MTACSKCWTELAGDNREMPVDGHFDAYRMPTHTPERCLTVQLKAAKAHIVTMGKEADECGLLYLATLSRREVNALTRRVAELESVIQYALDSEWISGKTGDRMRAALAADQAPRKEDT
jgi:hypothetical protein